MLEIWRAGGSNTGASAAEARSVEAEGWDGQMFMDSQCLSADPYALMAVWASATEKLKLSTGVTNPLSRNLAVTAAAAATIQSISGGRAVLGIGRGDSALAYLGHAPVGLARFQQAITQLQVMLSGGEIPFDAFGSSGDAASIHSLALGAKPTGVQLKWLPQGMAKVPLDVAATGPKVIAMSAPVAERVTFSVGADAERLAWALGLAHEARAAAGLERTGVSFGAQVLVVCHPDRGTAMEVAMHMAPPLARFQTMQGPVGPGAAAIHKDLGKLRRGYDMTEHGNIASKDRIVGGGALSPDFVSRFAVVGTPQDCHNRLSELIGLGLERLVVVGPSFYPVAWAQAAGLFAREVMPALRLN